MTEENNDQNSGQEPQPKAKQPNKTFIILLTFGVGMVVVYGVVTNLMKAAGSKLTEKTIETAMEQSTGEDVDVDINSQNQEMVVETEEGKLTVGKQEIPENFPSDLPIYRNSEIVTTVSSAEGIAVTLSTKDTVSDVSDYYQGALKTNGWTIVSTSTINNAVVYGIEKGEVSGGVIITESEAATQITLSVDLLQMEE